MHEGALSWQTGFCRRGFRSSALGLGICASLGVAWLGCAVGSISTLLNEANT